MRRLTDDADLLVTDELVDLRFVGDDRDVGEISGDASYLDVILLTDYDWMESFADKLRHRLVNSEDQWAGGVVDLESHGLGALSQGRRCPVSGDHHVRSVDLFVE